MSLANSSDLLDATADWAWADVVDNSDLLHPPRRRRTRRGGTSLLALTVALGLHASLLLLWRASLPPSAPEAIGQFGGAGGIQMSLVRGTYGASQPASAATDAVDQTSQPMQPNATLATDTPGHADAGTAVSAAPATGLGRNMGAVGETQTQGALASAGSGYDPGAYASLAPLSVAMPTTAELWEQARPCFKAPTPELRLAVIVTEAGDFVDAYEERGGLITTQEAGQMQAIEQAQAALRSCSPYHGLQGGLGRPLKLVVPAAASPMH